MNKIIYGVFIFTFFLSFKLLGNNPKAFLLIPQLKAKQTTVKDALKEIKLLSRDIDPSGKGVNIIIDSPNEKSLLRKVSLDLNNIPVKDAVKYVLTGTNFKITYKDKGNTIFLSSKLSKQLTNRFYNVSSSFPSFVSPQNIKNASQPDTLKNFLESLGIDFPQGSGVSYIAGKNKLSMNNTTQNHEKLINALILLGCFRLPADLR